MTKIEINYARLNITEPQVYEIQGYGVYNKGDNPSSDIHRKFIDMLPIILGNEGRSCVYFAGVDEDVSSISITNDRRRVISDLITRARNYSGESMRVFIQEYSTFKDALEVAHYFTMDSPIEIK